MEHLAIIKGFLEKNMSSGLTDYFEREVDKVSKEVERGRQCEFSGGSYRIPDTWRHIHYAKDI